MSEQIQIKCPECEKLIDVQDILARQLENEIKQKYQGRLADQKAKYETEREKLEKEKQEFENKKKQENELFQDRLEKRIKEDRKSIEQETKEKYAEEYSEQLHIMEKELNEKSKQVREFNRKAAEIEKLKREKSELREKIEVEAQQTVNEIVSAEKEKIKKSEEVKNELRFKELQKQLEVQMKLTEEMKRKQEQGSTQVQGEVQELAIEEWLASQFPLDSIEEIKKGAPGADCIQVVNTREQQNCGKIYYESKNTKNFGSDWIEKFKADIREEGADIGVLVTKSMPPKFDRMGVKDGVWICSYEEFKGLSAVLRESIIKLSLAVASQENKGGKMHMLYDYLTSNNFRMQVEAIVEGFSSMKIAMEKEKNSMQRIWKEREKQIEKVTINTINMYGSIKGIAGNAIQSVKALDFPESGKLEENNES